jgi:hypothetical protein
VGASPLTARLAVPALLAGAAVLAGCSGDPGDPGDPAGSGDPTGSAGPPSAATAVPEPAPTAVPSTGSAGTTGADPSAVADCEAVASARRVLVDATDAELSRLGVDRSAQEAFGITLVVASREAAGYWASLRDALSTAAAPDLRDDAAGVAARWADLDPSLDEVEIADGGQAAVRAALTRAQILSVPALDEDVVEAQQRVQEAVDGACGAAVAPTG